MTPPQRLAPRLLAVEQPLGAFGLTWLGQSISLVGSGLTNFALGVAIYKDTGSITQFSLITFVYFLPMVALSPIAGALVDRWDRRRAMLLSDLGAGFASLLIWLLLTAGSAGLWPLAPWHFYVPIALGSAFGAFRWPAYYATTALLVPKQHLGRANGVVELSAGIGQVAAPAVAGALLARIGLEGVIALDLLSFAVAVVTLLVVRFPRPKAAADRPTGPLWHDIAEGWTFVRARPGLFGLLLFIGAANLVWGLVTVLITPLVLSRYDVATLGMTLSAAGLGMLFGGIVMSAWGGPKRRIRGVLGFSLGSGVVLLAAALSPNALVIAAASFLFLFNAPLISSCLQAILQRKVAPEMQGRVFAVRRMISLSAPPVAGLIAGPLADRLFEPWLSPGGALAGSVGRLLGTGPGRGIALLLVLLGILLALCVIAAALSPRVRHVEDELPDALHPAGPEQPAPTS